MGKSTSKLRENRRAQSVLWSFRFTSQKRKKMVIANLPHLAIKDWLQRLDLIIYEDKFNNFDGVEDLMEFSERDIRNLGVKNSSHRARMISSLVALKDSFATKTRNGSMRRKSRFSLAIPLPPLPTKNSNEDENGSTYELLDIKSHKQSKSLGELDKMESPSPSIESPISQDAVAMKKALEWELALDSRDLRSHAWYHGPIPRQKTEELLRNEGEFLVRDCVSQPGNFVLSMKSQKSQTLHFVINKLLIQPETVYERVQYQFEEEPFDTVPDLITFYVGSGKVISALSGARISTPCNRQCPLSYYSSKYGISYSASNSSIGSHASLNSPSPVPSGTFRFNNNNNNSGSQSNSYRSPMSSPPRTKRDVPPRLPSKKQRSQSLTPVQLPNTQRILNNNSNNFNNEKYQSADGVITNELPPHVRRLMQMEKCSSVDGIAKRADENKEPKVNGNGTNSMTFSRSTNELMRNSKFSSHSLPRGQLPKAIPPPRTSSLSRDVSEQSLSPCVESKTTPENEDGPPPKPLKERNNKDEMAPINRVASYHASGSDSGNGSGDSAQSSATEDILQNRCGVVIKNPKFIPNSSSSVTLKSFANIDPIAAEEALREMNVPIIEQIPKFDLELFHTVLLPYNDYKPLDTGTLSTFRMMINETSPRIIANHMTRVDIKLMLGDIEEIYTRNPLESTGLELLMLDHGRQFRRDLIERVQCLKLLVAVTIVTCPTDDERADTLNKWIQIAVDTKTAAGNLFAFSAIMLGLCMPQIQKLETTWHVLRQRYTDSAFNFEAKLRPTLKSMNDCSNPQAPNTTIPHVLPYLLLKDRSIEDVLDPNIPQSSLVRACITPFELNTQDFGFSIMFEHLDAVRSYCKNMTQFKRNAKLVLNDQSRFDPLLEEAFRTEFHIKFLWGCKGAFVAAEERHSKFEQVLGMMADKLANKTETFLA